METISADDVKSLAEARGFPRVSIYMPTRRRWNDDKQGPVRLKNLLHHAARELIDQGAAGGDVRRLLDPAFRLADDQLFWRQQSEGLALFLSPGDARRWRLSLAFAEKAVANSRFHIRPLLPLITADGAFAVLALDQHRTRLFQARRHAMQELELPETAARMPLALPYDATPDQFQLRGHPAAAAPRGRGATMAPARGSGADERRHKGEIHRYFEILNDAVHRRLASTRMPLVLAGVSYLHGLYREVNTYPHLWPEGVTKNTESLSLEALRERAWEAVKERFAQPLRTAADRYGQWSGTPRVSDDVRQIAAAADLGRVDTLFLDQDAPDRWGRFEDERSARISRARAPGDEDLLDLAAARTLAHRGTVYAVPAEEVPGGGPAAALFRY